VTKKSCRIVFDVRSLAPLDSLLMVTTVERILSLISKAKSSKIEHEATTSKIGEDQVFYYVVTWNPNRKKQLL
jgi:hypothetical protein